MRRGVWFSAGLAAFVYAASVRADAGAADKAAAEALFARGIELMRTGSFAEACAKLEQSQSIERGIGAALYLAECYENLGRTASAWALYRDAASQAKAEGQTERAIAGNECADRLEPQLSKLLIRVPAEDRLPGFRLSRGTAMVSPATWDVEVPTDPGEYTIRASAPGRIAWSQVVVVKGPETTTVTVPALLAAPDVQTKPAHVPELATAVAPRDKPEAGGLSRRTMGLIVGGAGVVALGVGGIFGLRAISKWDDANQHSDGSHWTDATGRSLADSANDSARLANWFAIGGAVLLAGGAVLYLTAPSDHGTRVGFSSNAHGATVTFGGTL
jgi:serine/threonine-protein kinase